MLGCLVTSSRDAPVHKFTCLTVVICFIQSDNIWTDSSGLLHPVDTRSIAAINSPAAKVNIYLLLISIWENRNKKKISMFFFTWLLRTHRTKFFLHNIPVSADKARLYSSASFINTTGSNSVCSSSSRTSSISNSQFTKDELSRSDKELDSNQTAGLKSRNERLSRRAFLLQHLPPNTRWSGSCCTLDEASL